MLQVICNCGRIAEVRHRSNGNKLAYTHCKQCGGSPVSTAGAADIEAKAQENIGVKGEFLQKATDTVQSSPVANSQNWQPDANETPEVLETESENSETDTLTQSEKKPRGALTGLKIFAGILIASALGVTAYNVNKG